MLRFGIVWLCLSVCIALLFALLLETGAAHFGSCGPDFLGLVCLLGFMITGGVGVLLTAAGLLRLGFRKIWQ
jgi:hypothetical protein